MTAALTKTGPVQVAGKPVPTRLDRDLYQIGELVELCFAGRLDASGRAAVREMKMLGRMKPALWLLSPFDRLLGLGLGNGYVWREDRRVVGNVSIFSGGRHPLLGRGWLIANVAVHPDYRRQGIASELMQKSLRALQQRRGQWAVLQVDAGETAPLALYKKLGFEQFETLLQWENFNRERRLLNISGTEWTVRLRKHDEIDAEIDLVFNRARIGAMAWSRSIERYDIYDPFSLSGSTASGRREHWVMPYPHNPQKLAAVMWVQPKGWQQMKLTLFIDPAIDDPDARRSIINHTLRRRDVIGRKLTLETTLADLPAEELETIGFKLKRSLVQMRKNLHF